jgi:hypothetical protein
MSITEDRGVENECRMEGRLYYIFCVNLAASIATYHGNMLQSYIPLRPIDVELYGSLVNRVPGMCEATLLCHKVRWQSWSPTGSICY